MQVVMPSHCCIMLHYLKFLQAFQGSIGLILHTLNIIFEEVTSPIHVIYISRHHELVMFILATKFIWIIVFEIYYSLKNNKFLMNSS